MADPTSLLDTVAFAMPPLAFGAILIGSNQKSSAIIKPNAEEVQFFNALIEWS